MEDVLWHRAERAAKDLDRTPSWVIREALEQYLERRKAKPQDAAGMYVVQLDKEAAARLERIAQTAGKSPSDLIRAAVDRFVDIDREDPSQGV